MYKKIKQMEVMNVPYIVKLLSINTPLNFDKNLSMNISVLINK